MAHCLDKNVGITRVVFPTSYGSCLTPIFAAQELALADLASLLSCSPVGAAGCAAERGFHGVLGKRACVQPYKGEVINPLSLATTKQTINKILPSLKSTLSLWGLEGAWLSTLLRLASLHTSFWKLLQSLLPFFFTGTSHTTALAGFTRLLVSSFSREPYSKSGKQHKCAKAFHSESFLAAEVLRTIVSFHLLDRAWVCHLNSIPSLLPFGISLHPAFSFLFFQHRPFQRSLSAEGGRREQPCQPRCFQLSHNWAQPAALKHSPSWKQAALTDLTLGILAITNHTLSPLC